MKKTTWLLDVDGVINAQRPNWPDKDARATVETDGERWPLRWSPGLIDAIRGFTEDPRVDVVWCTTWCSDVAVLEELWQLPKLLCAWTWRCPAGRMRLMKMGAAANAMKFGGRLIWTDDDAIPSGRERRHLGIVGDALVIRPNPQKGLTPKHIQQISDFLRKGEQ